MSVVPGVRGCSAELTAEAVPCKNKEAWHAGRPWEMGSLFCVCDDGAAD